MKLDKYNRNTMDAILNNIGYVKNHNGLGYHKKCFTGVAFIRIARGMYGSNYYSWLFSFKHSKSNNPEWKKNRNRLIQEKIIRDAIPMKSDIKTYFTGEQYLKTECLETGECHKCRKRFDAPGFYCSLDCENPKIGMCEICKNPLREQDDMVKHHIAYFNEELIQVHRSCHTKLHHTKDPKMLDTLSHLIPSKDDSKTFYNQIKQDRAERRKINKQLKKDKIKTKNEKMRLLAEWSKNHPRISVKNRQWCFTCGYPTIHYKSKCMAHSAIQLPDNASVPR